MTAFGFETGPRRQRLEKMFGLSYAFPLSRPQKDMLAAAARRLSHPTEDGKAWGLLTAKALLVFQALLWNFHNSKTGLCFPSYEKIAEVAHTSRATVARAIVMLKSAGLLSWVNRLRRVRERVGNEDGTTTSRLRVVRTSNAYRLHQPSQSEIKAAAKEDRRDAEAKAAAARPAPPVFLETVANAMLTPPTASPTRAADATVAAPKTAASQPPKTATPERTLQQRVLDLIGNPLEASLARMAANREAARTRGRG